MNRMDAFQVMRALDQGCEHAVMHGVPAATLIVVCRPCADEMQRYLLFSLERNMRQPAEERAAKDQIKRGMGHAGREATAARMLESLDKMAHRHGRETA